GAITLHQIFFFVLILLTFFFVAFAILDYFPDDWFRYLRIGLGMGCVYKGFWGKGRRRRPPPKGPNI
ncbi:hypothetical protein CL620_02445, partial [archaeon]|nr:hypothetical protein [archaeon]